MFKRIISAFLAVCLTVSVATISVGATDSGDAPLTTTTTDIDIAGTNSLGSMLADEYEEALSEQETGGNTICEVTVENTVATVNLQVFTDLQLIVAVYDEAGQEMYCTGTKKVTSTDSLVQVPLNAETLPEYFMIKAYLLDPETNVPVCKQFECDTYTQAKQEFLAKTTADFEQEKVLNLDESNNNNFLVYNDQTQFIEGNEATNVVTSADNENKIYVIENIDQSISSLQVGDIFSYVYNEEEKENSLIVKIASITIEGTTATIQGADIELEEVFDYIKIDGTQGAGESSVDTSLLPEGVEFLGTGADAQSYSTSKKSPAPTGDTTIDEVILGDALTYKFANYGPVTGSVSLKFEGNIKCYYDPALFEKDELEFDLILKYSINVGVKLEFKTSDSLKIEMGFFYFCPVPGVALTFTPSLVFQGKISVQLNGVASGQIGKNLKNGVFTDKSKKMTFKPEVKVEGQIYIGLSLEPEVVVFGGVTTAKLTAKVGVTVKAEMKKNLLEEKEPEEKHLCDACIDGSIVAALEMSIQIDLFDNKNLTWKIADAKLQRKLCDFYYSFDTSTFAFTECPNKGYKSIITVVNQDYKPVSNATVNGETTGTNGKATLYLTKGTHTISVSSGDSKATKSINVINANTHIVKIEIEETTESTEESTNNSESESTSASTSPSETDPTESSTATESTEATETTGGNVVETKQPTIEASGKCGDDVYYTYYSDYTLIIYGNGDTYDYVVPGSSGTLTPFRELYPKKVIIKDGITSLGNALFYYRGSISTISIPDSVTRIGYRTFVNCYGLKSVKLSKNITKLDTGVFKGCERLESIEIPEGVTYIGNTAFDDCRKLTSISLPETLEEIDSFAFYDCENLTSIYIPDSVTSIGNDAFLNCTSLTTVRLSENLTFLGEGAFSSCEKLSSVNIPESLTFLPQFCFSQCKSLTSIKLHDKLERIYYRAFINSGLTSVYIPASVTKIEDAPFCECASLSEITISSDNPNYTVVDGNLYNKDVTKLIQYAPGNPTEVFNVPDTVTDIGNYALTGSIYLKEVYLGNTVDYVEGSAFMGCISLENAVLSNKMEILYSRTFSGCTSLKTITIPDSILQIDYHAFEDVESLTDVYYTGTEEQWQAIEIYTTNNGCLETATIHYNSPATNGLISESIMAYAIAEEVGTTELASKVYTRKNLAPGTEAVLMIIEGYVDYYEITDETILYIAQATVDETGTATFTAYGDFSDKYWLACIFGECGHNSLQWKTVNETGYFTSGLEVGICNHCGEVIYTREAAPKYPDGMYGDVNTSGAITINDVTAIQKHLAEITLLTDECQLISADVNQDGEININDATAIQKYLTKLVSTFE